MALIQSSSSSSTREWKYNVSSSSSTRGLEYNPSSSSSSTREWKYDVFVSFRGEDTRKKFTDHLYTGLEQKGISTFRDDEKLKRGTPIGPGLFEAIEESRFAVVILSSDYASSRWCLIELAKIVDCMKKTGLIVLPVFHYVDPSDVRNQRDIYAEAFKKHDDHFKDSNEEDVHIWKAALTEVASIAGWDLRDRHESKVIQEIVGTISSELNRSLSKNRSFSETISKNLVGIDSRVQETLDYCLCEGPDDVRVVGIWGMAGICETTVAQEIFRRIFFKFEASSFIANVKEETRNQGLVSLQKQLLSKILVQSEIRISNVREGINVLRNRLRGKKVLIVLDDVDSEEQLEALAGKHDWFGLGSRIILTSRGGYLLRRCGVDAVYTYKEWMQIHCSTIFQLWKGILSLDQLKFIDLSDCQVLIETPDFSEAPFLKRLILRRCTQLYKIHASLGNLKWLIKLDLNGCKCLKILPPKIRMESLEVFDLSGCSRLKKFPEIVGNMSHLTELYLNETAIEELPSSVEHLIGLTFLSLRNCKNLSSVTDATCTMTSLKTLILSGCSKLDELPENLGNLEDLEVLDVSGTAIKALPSSVFPLKNLRVISLCRCDGPSSKSLNKLLGFLIFLVIFNILISIRK